MGNMMGKSFGLLAMGYKSCGVGSVAQGGRHMCFTYRVTEQALDLYWYSGTYISLRILEIFD